MRVVGLLGLVIGVALAPAIASAGGRRDDGPKVRDHRSSTSGGDDSGRVRDHRSHDSAPVVRDHRGESGTPVVRDHRSSSGSSNSDGDAYFESSEASDGSGSFSAYTGPTYRLEIGGVARRFRGPAFARTGSVETTSGTLASYELASGRPAARDTAGGAFAIRFTVPASDHLYAGSEVELGGLTRTPIQLMTDSPEIHISTRSMVGSAAILGVRAQHGIVELDAEIAGGIRVVSMTMQSIDAVEDDPSESESALAGIVEARVRGALWIAPHVYVAAQAGSSVIDRGDLHIGLSIGMSPRAYGVRR